MKKIIKFVKKIPKLNNYKARYHKVRKPMKVNYL